MAMLEEVADRLAREVLKIVDATGDEDIIAEVKKTIGASSTTLEEAYMTAVRVRRAEARAVAQIAEFSRAHRSDGGV
jgi:ABC-type molybdenum transport system ATPase subunit/photorepair protein PhrA